MKTHEFADALIQLAQALKGSPNMELKGISSPSQIANNGVTSADAALSLSTLVALSKITKAQWRQFIAEWALPVDIKATDSVRDLVGRLLRYLEDHPAVLKKLHTESAKKSKKASPELMKALSILLGGEQP
jgi:hypothetical protein